MDILQEIINATCGKNAQDKPQGALTIECAMWAVDNEEDEIPPRVVSTHSAYKPVIEIEKHNDFIQIDLIFNTALDGDLKLIWNMLEKYGDLLNEVSDDSVEIPALSLILTPVIYDGQYYVLCMTPLFWTLQPQKPGGQANVIRLLYCDEDFGIFENDKVDLEAIDGEIERDIANAEATRAYLEAKETEYTERLSDRNDRLERMRGRPVDDPDYEEDSEFENVSDLTNENDNSDNNGGNNRFRII